MTHSGPKSFSKSKISIDPPDPKPVITLLVIFLMPICVWFLNPVLGMFHVHIDLITDGRIDWVEHNGFTPMILADALAKGPAGVIQAMPKLLTSGLAQLSMTMWALNGLFIWIFGSVVEKNLKSWRYPLFLVLMITTGWFCVYANAGFNMNKLYIGPSMMLFGLLGAYFAFLPKKAHKPLPWVKPPTEIFKKEEKVPVHERYFVNPWVYISAFAVFQILLQLALNSDKDAIVNATNMSFLGPVYTTIFGRIQENPAAFQPVAAIMQLFCGAVLAYVLPTLALSLKPKRPGGLLQLEVIQHYRELRTLDMTHEKACEGAAKFAAVPIEIAKDWISKGAAGLKDQDLRK